MIVVDTGAMIALLDRHDAHHAKLRRLYADSGDRWRLPWAILPEVDYLAGRELGARAQDTFLDDLATGAFAVDWGRESDIARALEINRQYKALRLGLVDAVVIAIAERLKARAIATLDVRHFGSVKIAGAPALLPRDA
jgi:predicted nucleic acid-binding protein